MDHKKTVKFGQNRACPHCVGDKAHAVYAPEEVEAALHSRRFLGKLHHESMMSVREVAKRPVYAHEGDKIMEALKHQARVVQVTEHEGWDIEVQAWVNVCPECNIVTEYRAMPSSKMQPFHHGPIESAPCTDCKQKARSAAEEAEVKRRHSLTDEAREAEDLDRAHDNVTIDQVLVDKVIEVAALRGMTGADMTKVLRLMNQKGQPLSRADREARELYERAMKAKV